MPLKRLAEVLCPYAEANAPGWAKLEAEHPEKAVVTQRIAQDLCARLAVLLDLGLGYLSLDRSTPTLSPGELQRLRLATQVRSNLFGVVYVLDEPSAGLHPADTEALLVALDKLKASGNSLFVVEHELDVIRHADWIVDVGPAAGENGGEILYSGPLDGARNKSSIRRRDGISSRTHATPPRTPREPTGWLPLARRDAQQSAPTRRRFSARRLHDGDRRFRLGKVEPREPGPGRTRRRNIWATSAPEDEDEGEELERATVVHRGRRDHRRDGADQAAGAGGSESRSAARRARISRPTPACSITSASCSPRPRRARARATMPAASPSTSPRAAAKRAKAKALSCVELLFLPSVYAPCPTCHGARYNAKTLEISYRGQEHRRRPRHDRRCRRRVLRRGAAHRAARSTCCGRSGSAICASVSRRPSFPAAKRNASSSPPNCSAPQRGNTLYVLDEPTTGLHPSDVEKLMTQLDGLVEAGNTVIVVEHDMHVVAASDWVIDIGPGAGDEGGRIAAEGPPREVVKARGSRTALYLARSI